MKLLACGFTADDQVAFAYGELPPDRAPAFAAHLIGCPTCRQALSELHQAARLCQRARETVVPTPVWHKPFPKPTIVWWQRPPVWAPALMVATAAAVWLLLLLASPAGVPRVFLPVLTPSEVIPFSPARPLEVTEVRGFASRTAPGGAQAWPLQKGDLVRDGDVVSATSGLQLRLHDGSRVDLLPGSRLHVDHSGPDMDRLRLTLGTITCRVERRNTSRSFQLEAGEFRATVLGTKFAVQVEAGNSVVVGVLEGEVEVVELSGTWPPRLIPANSEVHVRPEAAGTVQPLSRALAALLRPSSQPPPVTTAARLARLESPRPADVSPETGTTPEVRPAPFPSTATLAREGLEALVERIYRDTHWIFDDARAAMERGEFEAVTRRLENYIQDPDSPGRDEAVFLRAACLEKLGRLREAREHYRRYLWDWPEGRWVRDAQQGLVRTSRP